MSQAKDDPLELARATNERAAFNRWCGFVVDSARDGKAQLSLVWREELGQYAGLLHAGVATAMLDTACGFAALTLVGGVVASHLSVNFLRPASGERFVARAEVLRPGRQQTFTRGVLLSVGPAGEIVVATADTLLLRSTLPS